MQRRADRHDLPRARARARRGAPNAAFRETRGWFPAAACCAVAWFAAGCATHADRLHDVRTAFYANRLVEAEAAIARHVEKNRREADAFKLDRAMIELANGRPQAAERTLREVRDRLDYLEQASAGEKTVAMLTDDTANAYAGEDYEKVLVRVFLAMSNLLGTGEDALAYSFQVGDIQQRIIANGTDADGQNPKLAYKRVALGAYLAGAVREQSHRDYDDVLRCSATVAQWEPQFPFAQADVQRAETGRHSQKGNGALYAFTLVGHGPQKIQVAEVPSSVAMLIADRILSATGKHTLPPTIAAIKVPKVVRGRNEIRHVEVSCGGRILGQTATITDVGEFAVRQNEAVFPQIVARAVVRRAIKKAAIYVGKDALSVVNGTLGNFAMDVGGVVWEATERADTRCWGLLPDKIQVVRLELPAGEHEIALCPLSEKGYRGQTATAKVSVADGRNTYLIATFPDSRLVGSITTGSP
jgi:hypothetical protein